MTLGWQLCVCLWRGGLEEGRTAFPKPHPSLAQGGTRGWISVLLTVDIAMELRFSPSRCLLTCKH